MWKDKKPRPVPWKIVVMPGWYRVVAGNGEIVAKSNNEVLPRGEKSWVETSKDGQFVAYAGDEENFFYSETLTDKSYAKEVALRLALLI